MPTYRYQGRSFRSSVALSPDELDEVFTESAAPTGGGPTLPVQTPPYQAPSWYSGLARGAAQAVGTEPEERAASVPGAVAQGALNLGLFPARALYQGGRAMAGKSEDPIGAARDLGMLGLGAHVRTGPPLPRAAASSPAKPTVEPPPPVAEPVPPPRVEPTQYHGTPTPDVELPPGLRSESAFPPPKAGAKTERVWQGAAPLPPEEAAKPLQTPLLQRPGKALASVPERAHQAAHELMPQQFSVLTAAKEPAARDLGNIVRREWLSGQALTERELTSLRETVRPGLITKGDNEALARLLDAPPTPGAVSQVTPGVARAYHAAKGKFEQWRQLQGLGPEQTIAHYYPHMWNQDELVASLQAAAKTAATRGDTAAAQSLATQIAEVSAGRKTSFNQLPREVQNQFHLHRSGMPGYSSDALATMEYYLDRMIRKVHGDRMLKARDQLAPQITDEALRTHAKGLIDRYVGPSAFGQSPGLGAADQLVRRAAFLDILGANPKWQFGTNIPGGVIMEVSYGGPVRGPRNAVSGVRLLRTPEGAEAFQQSGHGSMTMARDLAERPTASENRFMQAWTLFASSAERGLRGSTWLGTIADHLGRRGMSFNQVRDALKAGTVPKDVIYAADEAVARTQGLYGLDNPAVFERPGMKALAQFGAVPAKQLQTFLSWMKSPKTAKYALTYAALSEAYQEALMASTGVDVSRAFGVGLDFPRILQAYEAMQKGKPDAREQMVKAFTDSWAEGRAGIFSIAVLSGPAATMPERLGKAGKAGVEWAAGIPGAADRAMERTGGVSGLGGRAWRAMRGVQQGAPPGEIAREALNIGGPKSAWREFAFREARQGKAASGQAAIQEWNRRHPSDPIALDPQAWREAAAAGERLEAERKRRLATQDETAKWRQRLPARAKGGL